MKVLFLAMQFPPVNTTGCHRILKFVKHLPKFDIQPIIVTIARNDAARLYNKPIEIELLKQLPKDIIVYEIPCNLKDVFEAIKLKRLFSITDNIASHWEKELVKHLPKIIKKEQPKIIFASLPPFSAGPLAAKIAKKYSLPLVIDMRDAWLHFGLSPFTTRIHYYLTLLKERKTFKQASVIITVTKQLKDLFKNTHNISDRKIELIPNGYDSLKLPDTIKLAPINSKNEFTIGHAGVFYYNPQTHLNTFGSLKEKGFYKFFQYNPPLKQNWFYRSPDYFFKALNIVFKKHPAFKEKVKIQLIGDQPKWLSDMVVDYGLQSNCCFTGFLPKKKVLHLQNNFDILLTTGEKSSGGESLYMPSKIFDYLSSKKPILGFVPKGAQKDFLQSSDTAIICDPDNLDESVTLLLDMFLNGQVFYPKRDFLDKYSIENLSLKLSDVFKDLIN